ncbi:MAG: nicotinate-nucleotide adenylyltransferase [Gammaproteobacteria bacterium]
MPVGILGGTFDPVHHGHLRLALETLELAGLDHVRMVPLHTPPHRGQPVAAPEQRREMLRLALEGIDSLILEDCELRREGVSYTIDTLQEIKACMPDRHLCLIMGMDALQSLNTWHRWRAIPKSAHIIVVERPNETMRETEPGVAALLGSAATTDSAVLQEKESGAILRIRIPALDISSTRLREMFASGQDPRFLLPSQVLEFIYHENLYVSEQT